MRRALRPRDALLATLLVAPLVLLLPATSIQGAPSSPEVKVLGISIQKRPIEGRRPIGTRLGLRIAASGAPPLLHLDLERSKVVMVDSTGRELRWEGDAPYQLATFADDRRAVMLDVIGGPPATGAERIQARGSVLIVASGGEGSLVARDLEMRPGATSEVAGVRLTVVAAGPPVEELRTVWFEGATDFDNYAMTYRADDGSPLWATAITLDMRGDIGSLGSIRLLDPGGQEIAAEVLCRAEGPGRAAMELLLPRIVPRVTVELAYWKQGREIAVPVDVVATLGL